VSVRISRTRWRTEVELFTDRRWGAKRTLTAVWTEGSLGFLLYWLEPAIPDGFRDQYAYWVSEDDVVRFAKAFGIDAVDPIAGLAEKWSGEERAIELRRRLRRLSYVRYDRAEEARERSDAAIEALDPFSGRSRRTNAAARKAILREELERALGDTSREYLQNIHVAFIAAVSRVTQTPRREITQELCESVYPGFGADRDCFPDEDNKLIRYAGGRPESVSFSDGSAFLDAYTFGDTDYWMTEGNYPLGAAPADSRNRLAVIKAYITSIGGATIGEFELTGLSKADHRALCEWVDDAGTDGEEDDTD